MRSVGAAAPKEAVQKLAAHRLVLVGERSLIGTGSEGQLVFVGKAVGREPMADAGKLQAMEMEADLAGRGCSDFHAIAG
jgi:hypothetical protein